MLLGHCGVAFAAKRAAPRTSLGTLNLFAELLDELWPIFLLMGFETVRVAPGVMAANPLEFVHYPITHSLVGAIGMGACCSPCCTTRCGATPAARSWLECWSLSHWFLDLPMHAPDLPLWPGSGVKVGLGGWRSIPLTIAIELAVFGGGLMAYVRATRAKDMIGGRGLWLMVVTMLGVFFAGFASGPPPSERAVAIGALGLWVFVPVGWLIDRHRELVASDAGRAVSL